MRFYGLLLLASLLFVGRPAAGQQTTFWELAEPITDSSIIVTDGELVESFNGSPVEDEFVVVNDIPFVNTRFDPLTGASGGMLQGSTGDENFDALLRELSFGGGTSPSMMIGNDNLEIGQSYMLQVFFTDMRNCCNQRVMTYGLDGITVDVSAGEGEGEGGFG